MTLKDEALAQIQQEQAAAARAEALRRNPPPVVYEYSVEAATEADIRVLVEEFQRRNVGPLPMLTVELTSKRVKRGWSRKTETQYIRTATHVTRGWLLTYNGKPIELGITVDGGLVPASGPHYVKDGEHHYAVPYSSKMGMHNGFEYKADINHGFGSAKTGHIEIGAANLLPAPTDWIVVERIHSSNCDDVTDVYQTLHEVLVGTFASLMS
jgi:hypothetical protein